MRWMAACEVFIGLAMLASTGVTRAQAPAAPTGALAESRVFVLEEMPVRKMANGGESWDVVHGALATGEVVGVHESEQPAGATPSPMHTIQHSELIVVQEGDGGVRARWEGGEGGAGWRDLCGDGDAASSEERWRQAGEVCGVAIGGDTKKVAGCRVIA